jgi:hypothetical protein
MLFKLLTAVLTLLLAAETLYILKHRLPTNNRFRPVESYDGIVAFDTATGQLCKTLLTKSAAEIKQSTAEAAKKSVPCPPLSPPSGDSVVDKIERYAISKECGGSGEVVVRESDTDSTLEFVAKLPACADIR